MFTLIIYAPYTARNVVLSIGFNLQGKVPLTRTAFSRFNASRFHTKSLALAVLSRSSSMSPSYQWIVPHEQRWIKLARDLSSAGVCPYSPRGEIVNLNLGIARSPINAQAKHCCQTSAITFSYLSSKSISPSGLVLHITKPSQLP